MVSLTFCTATGSGLKDYATRYSLSRSDLQCGHGCKKQKPLKMILSYDEKNLENSEKMDVRNMRGNTGKETYLCKYGYTVMSTAKTHVCSIVA